ncbi:MAG: rRNA pseudouridine synthase [Dorea sp.]|nr:rRNA pseudouridine synthase [Dorea sp.]MCI9614671.1 rRNA pseudouridine synthase [Dorea sp.]
MIRLDKYLADMGTGTRQEVKKYIRKGLVRVNQETVRTPEMKICEEKDEVFLEGQRIAYASCEYYMLNKPAGVVSATEDKRETTVIDLIRDKKRKDLFPVGRLDKDTEGLLLITNDGQLAHRLLSPKRHVDKTYYAKVSGCVTKEDVLLFARGLDIGTDEREERTMPGELEILRSGSESEILLTIQEGKYHQVKRMFQAVGKEVVYLRRERMGALVLDKELKPGEYRPLTKKELENVKNEDA